MKRLLGFLVFIAVLVVITIYIAQKYLFIKISPREVISRIIPPSKDIKQFLPQSSENSTPLVIPNGLSMDIFVDLKGGLPRVLAFDQNDVLFASIPNMNKVIAIPDDNQDGKADRVVDVVTGLNKPHGLVFDGGYLYVAETNGVSRYTYNADSLSVSNKQLLFSLPAGGRHSTRTIKINGGKLYTSVGSSCDVCIESSPLRAAILVSNLDGSDLKVFAKGLRNTVFFAFDDEGKMWGNDMGRDFLGDNLPPDELNIIEEGKDYGWPYCYSNKFRDSKFKQGEESTYCTDTVSPVYEYPAHVAPLGITFDSEGNILSAFHGSWNSSLPVGYRIVKLTTFAGGVSGMSDYIKGFLKENKEVLGRPVDLVYDKNNKLYISDDHTGVIYILYK